MAFSGGGLFGQPAQPAFGQPPQPSQTSHPFGAANGSTSPPNGKITFGARAAVKQPAAVSSTSAQPAAGFGAAAGFEQNSFSSLNGTNANPFGQNSTPQSSAPFGSAPTIGPGAASGGFGAVRTTGALFEQNSSTEFSASFGGGAANGIGAVQGTGGVFGGQQTGQGFGTFGAAAAPSANAAPTTETKVSNPFARLGARIEPNASIQPKPSNQDQSLANSTHPKPFGSFGQPAQPAATGSANQTSGIGEFGSQQTPSAVGFGAGAPSGTDAFAGLKNASQIQAGDFGRANKQKQQEPQQQQPQGEPQQRPRSAALRQQAKPKLKTQHQTLSNDLADPAALAARSARFGQSPQRPVGGFGQVSQEAAADRSQPPQQEDVDGNEAEGLFSHNLCYKYIMRALPLHK